MSFFLPCLVLSVVLLLISAVLVWTHMRRWQGARRSRLAEHEHDFAWRQFRRRIQASSMLGLSGLGVFFGGVIPPKEQPSLFVFTWLAVTIIVVWILLLALADMVATRSFMSQTMKRHFSQQARFAATLRREHADRHDRADSP